MMGTLTGKTAIVTGGSRGIGRAIVAELSRRGASVVFTHMRPLEEPSPQIEGGGTIVPMLANVRDPEAARQVIDAAVQRFGGIDILVNNAGIVRDRPAVFMSADDWGDVLATNLSGAFHYTQASLQSMMRRGEGRIVHVSSVGAIRGTAGQVNYSASKAGLLGMTRSLAAELAAFKITVNAVLPGFVDTEILNAISQANKAKLTRSIPAQRFGKPDEVSSLVGFLVSSEAAYITGQAIAIDGGLSN
jgi:3-oxoacyl-[acyl-carrier protein] reductase